MEKLPVHLNFSLIRGVTLLYILPLFQFSGNSMRKNSIYLIDIDIVVHSTCRIRFHVEGVSDVLEM